MMQGIILNVSWAAIFINSKRHSQLMWYFKFRAILGSKLLLIIATPSSYLFCIHTHSVCMTTSAKKRHLEYKPPPKNATTTDLVLIASSGFLQPGLPCGLSTLRLTVRECHSKSFDYIVYLFCDQYAPPTSI